jgi:hypothetical protein
MTKINKFCYGTLGLFFQGAKLYRIDLNSFDRDERLEVTNEFEFFMPTAKDLQMFEILYENLPDKMNVIKKRFELGIYLCFAYRDTTENKLAYTRWICSSAFFSDAMRKKLNFKEDEALTLDSYTHPDYRYHGLHKKMNILMLQWLKANTKIRDVYMVILMFIPHLTKIPLELGYKPIESTFYYKKGSFQAFLHLIKRKLNA